MKETREGGVVFSHLSAKNVTEPLMEGEGWVCKRDFYLILLTQTQLKTVSKKEKGEEV